VNLVGAQKRNQTTGEHKTRQYEAKQLSTSYVLFVHCGIGHIDERSSRQVNKVPDVCHSGAWVLFELIIFQNKKVLLDNGRLSPLMTGFLQGRLQTYWFDVLQEIYNVGIIQTPYDVVPRNVGIGATRPTTIGTPLHEGRVNFSIV
jgi:hypothetical protein